SDFLKTQFELLKSRAMAERVVSTLKLMNDGDFLASGRGSIGTIAGFFAMPKPKPENSHVAAIALIVQGVEVKPVIGSRLVDVSYTDPNPGRAQKKANAYAENFLDDQIKQLKLRMEESERAGLEFAEKEKIVEVNDKASVAENN